MALPTFDSEWFGLDAAEKIRRFNAAGTSINELRSITDEETIQWMLNNGYSPPPAYTRSYDRREQEEEGTYNYPTYYYASDGTAFLDAGQRDAYQNSLPTQRSEQDETRAKAASVGVNLPSNWFQIGPQEKVNWLIGSKVTEGQLRAFGTPEPEIQSLKDLYGYYDATKTTSAPPKPSISLPSEWGNYDPKQKIDYFNEKK